jgi:hypothetical protein
MMIDVAAVPEQHVGMRILVGQDRAGHWLVQADDGRLEGHFISREAALGFARAEAPGYPGAVVALAAHSLVPAFAMTAVQPKPASLAQAA